MDNTQSEQKWSISMDVHGDIRNTEVLTGDRETCERDYREYYEYDGPLDVEPVETTTGAGPADTGKN